MGFLMALCTMNGQAGLQTKAHIKGTHTHSLTQTSKTPTSQIHHSNRMTAVIYTHNHQNAPTYPLQTNDILVEIIIEMCVLT